MTQLVVTLTEDLVDTAFKNATDKQNAGLDDASLQSISGAVRGALDNAYVKIRDVVKECSLKGWENAQGQVLKVLEDVTEEENELVDSDTKKFRKQLLDHLRRVIAETFNLVLSFMPSEVVIGEVTYRLTSVELEHKLVLSGSIEASLTALCKFVGSGEFVVKGAYGMSSELGNVTEG